MEIVIINKKMIFQRTLTGERDFMLEVLEVKNQDDKTLKKNVVYSDIFFFKY